MSTQIIFNLQHNDESHRMDQPGRDMLVTINSFILGNTSVISMIRFEIIWLVDIN